MNGIIPPLHGVSAFASNEDPIMGNGPIFYWGNTAPDGDAAPWAQSQIGTEYTYVYDRHGTQVHEGQERRG